MTWQPRAKLEPWRPYLTPDEEGDLAALEKQAAKLDTNRRVLTQAMNLLRNRACKRRLKAQRRQKAAA